ncbi:TetR/AcrR family transcriptional regulator [Marimonas lutisalis]|uniref:TetR/AcrR family transcriptional regulator n=1 Tax=Marimonas lutisalis TaxID=2545756 RepID=UPI0010F76B47|nr:TetR/AcrR family transcriptional regulator [Marimonas lutisalis]
MGRKAGFADEDVYAVVAKGITGDAMPGIKDISLASGVSVGSLYHRFGSFEGLLTEVWAWSEGAYLKGVLNIMEAGGVRSGLRAALHMVRYCRKSPEAAPVLTSAQRAALRQAALSGPYASEARALLDDMEAALEKFASDHGITREEAELAIMGFPRAIVRTYLAHGSLPGDVDVQLRQSFWGVISANQRKKAA